MALVANARTIWNVVASGAARILFGWGGAGAGESACNGEEHQLVVRTTILVKSATYRRLLRTFIMYY